MTKRYRDLSDSQANAEALTRRERPWTGPSQESFSVQWDWRRRQPKSLREAVSMARALHAAEIPSKLHEGPDSIGPDGTPKMTARAEGYIFGSGTSDDAPRNPESGERDPVGYYHAPFRARLAEMSGDHDSRCLKHGICTCVPHEGGPLVGGDHPSSRHYPECAVFDRVPCNKLEHKRAAIVQHVTIGQQAPVEAAISEGVPSWCARLVAEDALRAFLHSMSDLKFHLPRQEALEGTVTAA